MTADIQKKLVEYYADIIPDIAAFQACVVTPLPKTFWTNPLIVDKSIFNAQQVQRLSWNKSAYRYCGTQTLSSTWQYQLGLVQIQEEVSMLPVKLLNPQPHEAVIDLCAAPGNKTAEIAAMMQNTGTVVANDRNYQRMKALGQVMRRLGLLNITMTVQDGCAYQSYPNYFDKVLVDAPCSCEGTLRKRPHKQVTPNPKQHRYLAATQIALLKKAITLCKPGGRIVYSTCTFSPTENEAVISTILTKYSDHIEIEKIALPDFVWSEGLSSWQNETFHPDVKHSMRVWPHQNDSGGFYVAVLRKKGLAQDHTIKARQLALDPSIQDYLDELQQRFQFPESLLSQYGFEQASARGIYIRNKDHLIPQDLKHDVSGLIFMKSNTRFPKLSTGVARAIGRYATINKIELNAQQLQSYLSRETCSLDIEQCHLCNDSGYVIVTFQGYVAGLGLYLSGKNGGSVELQSLFPKSLVSG